MSKGLDYSKWNKIIENMDTSDDDDDLTTYNDNDTLGVGPANVTKLDKPSRVTIGPNGATINTPTFDGDVMNPKVFKQTKGNNYDDNIRELNEDMDINVDRNDDVKVSSDDRDSNDKRQIDKWFENGGIHGNEYIWSQSRDNVLLKYFIPKSAKKKDIKIKYNNDKKQLSMIISNQNVNKIFNYEIIIDSDDIGIDYSGLDWEIKSINIKNPKYLKEYLSNEFNNINIDSILNTFNSSKFLEFDIIKKHISNNVILWWDKVFTNETKIDIQKRVKNRVNNGKNMNDVWNEAHKLFRQKAKNTKPKEINLSDDNLFD